jgi:hypothetical protein
MTPSRLRPPQTADDEEAARLIRHLHYPLTTTTTMTPAGEMEPLGDGTRVERGLVNGRDESGAWRNTMRRAGSPLAEYNSRTYSRG